MKTKTWGCIVITILLISIALVFFFAFYIGTSGGLDTKTSEEYTISTIKTTNDVVHKPVSVERQVYDTLVEFGISPAGACGILANAKAESDLCPNNLENFYNRKFAISDVEYTNLADKGEIDFVHDTAGYGLWQFTYHSFKQVLFDMARTNGASVSDVKTQVKTLIEILKTPEFSKLFRFLKETNSPENAAKEFMLIFERPANQSESAIATRVVFATEFLIKRRKLKMGKFANIYNEERTKEQYVDDKIQMLDDFLIFSKRPFLNKRTVEDRKSWVKRILMIQETDIQIDALCRMLTVKEMPVDTFIDQYAKKYFDI